MISGFLQLLLLLLLQLLSFFVLCFFFVVVFVVVAVVVAALVVAVVVALVVVVAVVDGVAAAVAAVAVVGVAAVVAVADQKTTTSKDSHIHTYTHICSTCTNQSSNNPAIQSYHTKDMKVASCCISGKIANTIFIAPTSKIEATDPQTVTNLVKTNLGNTHRWPVVATCSKGSCFHVCFGLRSISCKSLSKVICHLLHNSLNTIISTTIIAMKSNTSPQSHINQHVKLK